MSYEFIIAGLPDLKQGSLLSTDALTELLEEQLSDHDKQLWRSLVGNDENDENDAPLGLLDRNQGCKNSFLKEWFAFNHDLNNILTAAICRKHNLDLRKQIRVESAECKVHSAECQVGNSVAEQILANPNAKDFGLTGVSSLVEEVLHIAAIENLLEREKAIDAIRQAWLEEYTLFNDFGIEKVLSYWLQNEILHRWDALTMETGQRVFRELVNEMKKSIKI